MEIKMSKNKKEWLIAFIVLISLFGFSILYIYIAREIQSEIKLGSNLKTKFIKNFITPNGIDFSLLFTCHTNDKFEGYIVLKEENKVIYQKKINNSTIESYTYSNNPIQMKYYIFIPQGLLKQNILLWGIFRKFLLKTHFI